jgi:hypothetical protein
MQRDLTPNLVEGALSASSIALLLMIGFGSAVHGNVSMALPTSWLGGFAAARL